MRACGGRFRSIENRQIKDAFSNERMVLHGVKPFRERIAGSFVISQRGPDLAANLFANLGRTGISTAGCRGTIAPPTCCGMTNATACELIWPKRGRNFGAAAGVDKIAW
jgi:hypothetical protein